MTTTTIQIIPPELQERIAALTAEAKAMLPAVEDLAKRVYLTQSSYWAALEDAGGLFDHDVAAERTGFEALYDAVAAIGDNIAGALDTTSAFDKPEWLRQLGERESAAGS